MRRIFSGLFVAVVAALLSLVLAVPSHAADIFPPDQTKFKYGLDYWRRSTQGTPAGPSSPVKVPVSPLLNPSATGGSWYLRNQQLGGSRTVNPANKPLTGKIIEPGKTIVRAPSTIATAPKFVAGGTPGFGKLLGGLGFGVGGTVTAPSNADAIALSKGVSQGCLDGGACTGAETKTRVDINACGLMGNCDTIGAKGPNGESAAADWFKTDALPFLRDLWAAITGQGNKGDELPDANGHYERVPRGCYNVVGPSNITFLGSNNIEIRPTFDRIIVNRPPPNTIDEAMWDSKCAPSLEGNIAAVQQNAVMDTTCIDKTTGKAVGSDGQGLGVSWPVSMSGVFDNSTKKNAVALCKSGANNVLQAVQFKNTDSDFSSQSWNYMKYSRHESTSPDAVDLDTTEGETATTTVNCQAPDGQNFTYSSSVSKTAAFAAPACPAGTTMTSHDVKTNTAGGTTATLDSGTTAPGAAAAYPGCMSGQGCTMTVQLDNTPCASTRSECQNWPAIAASQPSRVQCKWGTYTVPTSDCFALSNAYKSESGVVFDPVSGAWTAIDTYGNPIQPNPEPWNPTNPAPAVGQAPGTSTGTGTGTSGFPGSGTSPSDGCVSPSWSWNPVDWVKSPVVCALKDAFVPKYDVPTKVAQLQTLTAGKPPLSWLNTPMVGPGGGGCPNWVISVPGFSKNVVCESSFTASIVGARGPLFGLVATAMMWPLLRSIWYAAIPILRVSPGSSK